MRLEGIIMIAGAIIFIIVLFILLLLYLKNGKKVTELLENKASLEGILEELEKANETLRTGQKECMKKCEELKGSEERYKKLAYMDVLTELPNRLAFTERLTATFATLRQDENVAVMYLDIENLKEINDSLGYTYGDELLIDISHRLRQVMDEKDYLARFGGDEFIILTKNIEEMSLYEEKVKKMKTIFSYPFTLANKDCFVHINIGIAKLGVDGKTVQSLIKNVTLAMYEAKRLGNNQYYYYKESLQTEVEGQIKLETEVRNAVQQNEFVTYYQPILDLKNHVILGFEALLRWNHPERGMLLPYEFIEVAKESGIIVSLGEQMMRGTCTFIHNLSVEQANNKLLTMINLSQQQILNEELTSSVESAIMHSGVLPEQLVFEVSEEVFDSKEEVVFAKLEELRALGAKLSLDNFGRGRTSLALVKRGIFSYVKLDMASFLMLDTKEERDFVQNLAKLLEDLQLTVIYQGVEEESQLSMIEQMPTPITQGFLFEKPLNEQQVREYLETLM